MKTVYILTLFLFAVQFVSAQVFSNDELTISVIGEQLWVVETFDNTTMYIIEGKEKALLVDTGTECKELDKVVRKITQKPLYVVVTHMHLDHAGNMNFFDDIYFHPADSVLLYRLPKPYSGNIHYINDGHVFDLGERKIMVSHMPGHTPGSIVLLDEKAGNCYSGDAFGSGQVWCQLAPFSPMKTYAASCKKMQDIMDKGIRNILCGHYPYIKQALSRSYIDDMYQLALMIDEGSQPSPSPHPTKIPGIGAKNPMMSTIGQATIVYDPEHIK